MSIGRWWALASGQSRFPDTEQAGQDGAFAERNASDDRTRIEYLLLEVSRLRALVRHLAADKIDTLPMGSGTLDSFDYQWRDTVDGNWFANRPELKTREPAALLACTGLAKEWFADKEVLDAGCGSGRFSWALASLGARVTAVDQSAAGVAHTAAACREFGDAVRVMRHDLRMPLPFVDLFDLVFCFGVLHHTGDAFGAFQRLAAAVRPGGYLFVMMYAEPDVDDVDSMRYHNEVERLRRATAGMSFQQRYEYIKTLKGADAGGWFDAVSPAIADLHPLHELKEWFTLAGFTDLRRTMDHPNHHLIARKL